MRGVPLFPALLREIAESETVEGNCPEGNGVVQCSMGGDARGDFP